MSEGPEELTDLEVLSFRAYGEEDDAENRLEKIDRRQTQPTSTTTGCCTMNLLGGDDMKRPW